jgi:hypothetical protein
LGVLCERSLDDFRLLQQVIKGITAMPNVQSGLTSALANCQLLKSLGTFAPPLYDNALITQLLSCLKAASYAQNSKLHSLW